MGRHGDEDDSKPESVAEAVTEMKIENEDSTSDGSAPETPHDEVVVNGSVTPSKPTAVFTTATKNTTTNNSSSNTTPTNGSRSSPMVKSRSQSHSPTKDDDDEPEKKMGGEITVKMEPGQPPKLARTSSQKVVSRPPQLFNHLPDDTDAAKATFQLMDACTYANKYMGYTEHAMECDCAEEWGKLIFHYFPIPPNKTHPFQDFSCSASFMSLVYCISYILSTFSTSNQNVVS